MKIRRSSIFSGIAFAALLAACIPSTFQAQQQPAPQPAPAPMATSSAPGFDHSLLAIEDGSGWLGVSIEEVSADKAKELKLPAVRGVLLADVEEDSPAGKAGLKSGDVITEFDGERVEGTLAFRRMVRETPPGRPVELAYWRDGSSASTTVELESLSGQMRERARQMADQNRQMSQEMAQEMPQRPLLFNLPEDAGIFTGNTPTLGIAALNLSGQLGHYFGAPDGQGVLVGEVRDSTPASKAGLQAGDVITKVDGERVHDISDLRATLTEKRADKSVTLSILRKGAELSIPVEPQAPDSPMPVAYANHQVNL